MELADFSKPGERKKLIWAAVLGLIAIIFLWWTFIGFGKSTPRVPARPSPTSSTLGRSAPPRAVNSGNSNSTEPQLADISYMQEIPPVSPGSGTNVPEPKRNIFAYVEKAKPVASPTVTPTPTPSPPVLLANINPPNVYARTADFTLELSGDKFTPDMRVFVDGRDLPTKYKGPQQMTATVAAAIIASPGVRQIKVQTPNGSAYSGVQQLSVAPAPTPNYSYVGIIGTPTHVDTALLQDKNNKEILSVQRGDLLSGRFRVTSISEKEVVFLDANLKIKHTLAMTEGEKVSGAPLGRPTPRVDAEDDEP
jgi:hypothetical protein